MARHGEVYVTGLESHTRLQAEWRDTRCSFEVAFPVTREPLPRLGDVLCVGIVP